MLIRRLRGLLASIVGGTVVGAVAGVSIGLLVLHLPGTTTITPEFPGAVLVIPAALGAIVGGLSGAAFGTLLMLAERGRGIDDLRAYRVATWAAIASATALRFATTSWPLVALGGGLGAATAAGATWLAKRGAEKTTPEQINAPPT
jgi:hypothetical protein